jgi:hypothetical protein
MRLGGKGSRSDDAARMSGVEPRLTSALRYKRSSARPLLTEHALRPSLAGEGIGFLARSGSLGLWRIEDP